MISRIVILFAVLLASMYIGVFLQTDPGYVFITIHHWTIESTLWVALTALFIIAILLHLFLLILSSLANIPTHWHLWLTHRRTTKAQAKTKQGLIEFAEGHWKSAKKHLIMAAPNVELPFINYLTAAKAAEALGDHVLRDHYLKQAQTSDPEATLAIEITQAQLQIDNEEWDEALAKLRHLQTISPNHPYVIKLLSQLHQTQKNWSDLIQLLPQLKTSKIITDTSYQHIRHEAYAQNLQQLIEHKQNVALKQFIKNIPKDLKYDSDLTERYCSYLLQEQQDKAAEAILRASLLIQVHNPLISLYARVSPNYTDIPFIKALIQNNPDSARLPLCLGQLLVTKQLWGAAKEQFEKSIQIAPTREAYYQLGRLFEMLNDQHQACHTYRQGLEL